MVGPRCPAPTLHEPFAALGLRLEPSAIGGPKARMVAEPSSGAASGLKTIQGKAPTAWPLVKDEGTWGFSRNPQVQGGDSAMGPARIRIRRTLRVVDSSHPVSQEIHEWAKTAESS